MHKTSIYCFYFRGLKSYSLSLVPKDAIFWTFFQKMNTYIWNEVQDYASDTYSIFTMIIGKV